MITRDVIAHRVLVSLTYGSNLPIGQIMKHFYLAGTILGTVVPYVFFIDFFLNNGIYVSDFINGVFANGAASGFTADLLISSFAFWGYLIANQQKRIALYVVLNLTIGLSCALPLYLYLNELDREKATASGATEPA